MKHDEIMRRLSDEALNDADAGWISDLSHHILAWSENDHAITIHDAERPWKTEGIGSIDLGHLASIVEGLLAEQRSGYVKLLGAAVEADSGLDSHTRAWAIQQIEGAAE